MRGLVLALLVSMLAFLSLPRAPSAAAAATCSELAAEAERRERLPRGILHAIALTETGRWDPKAKVSYAWPWMITAKDDTFVADSAEETLGIVRKLRADGRENIDVGCMQVNLMYHGEEFDSLEQAIDPATNMAYAARFLKSLWKETHSWSRAVQRYHSNDPERGRGYLERVNNNWKVARKLQRALDVQERAERKASLVARAAARRSGAIRAGTTQADADRADGGDQPGPGAVAIFRAGSPAPFLTQAEPPLGGQRAETTSAGAVTAVESVPGAIVAIHGLDIAARTLPKVYRPLF